MGKALRAAYDSILVIAGFVAALSCSSCAGDGGGSTVPPADLLPDDLEQVRLGMQIEEVRRIAPNASFYPYDGLQLALDDDRSGFRKITFFTGDLYPERPPAADARLREIHLAGDSVDANVAGRISGALGGAQPVRRCAPSVASDVFIWEPEPPNVGVELIVSRISPRRTHLRMFSGSWRETPVTAGFRRRAVHSSSGGRRRAPPTDDEVHVSINQFSAPSGPFSGG
jgi:hypothetical protein